MQTSILHSHDPVNDYRLIIDTPRAIHKKIAVIKTQFDEEYRGLVVAGGNPFIYLATFSQEESKEQETVDAIHRIAIGFIPFRFRLKNFGHIEKNEIYVNVEEPGTINFLVDQLITIQDYMQNARFNENPRITIAQRLQAWQFDKSWPVYAHKQFSATLLADQILLLKRMEGFRSWQILKHLALQNQFITE